MKQEKRIILRWNTQVKTILLIFLLCVFLIGAVSGFFIGKAITPKTCEVLEVPTPTIIETPTESAPETPEETPHPDLLRLPTSRRSPRLHIRTMCRNRFTNAFNTCID